MTTIYPHFYFYSIGSFPGGGVALLFNGESIDDKYNCKQKIEFEFPSLNCSKEGKANVSENNNADIATFGLLQIVPNPSKNQTKLRYKYKEETTNRYRKLKCMIWLVARYVNSSSMKAVVLFRLIYRTFQQDTMLFYSKTASKSCNSKN